MMSLFSENVEIMLKKVNVSQKKLCDSLGINKSAVNHWKDGAMPSVDVGFRVAQFFDVSVEWLLTGKEAQKLARISSEALELAEYIFRLPVKYQDIIKQNVELYKKLCFKLEEESTRGIG